MNISRLFSLIIIGILLFGGCSNSGRELSPPSYKVELSLPAKQQMDYKMELDEYPEWANKRWRSLMFLGKDVVSNWRVFHIDIDSYDPHRNTYRTIDGKTLGIGSHLFELSDFDIVHDNFRRWKYSFFPCTKDGVWHSRYDEEDDVSLCEDCKRYYCSGTVTFPKSDGSVQWSRYNY
jgi:hypothetical protein